MVRNPESSCEITLQVSSLIGNCCFYINQLLKIGKNQIYLCLIRLNNFIWLFPASETLWSWCSHHLFGYSSHTTSIRDRNRNWRRKGTEMEVIFMKTFYGVTILVQFKLPTTWISVLLVWEIYFLLRVEPKIYEYSSSYFLGNDIWLFTANSWRSEETEHNSWCNPGASLCHGCHNSDQAEIGGTMSSHRLRWCSCEF